MLANGSRRLSMVASVVIVGAVVGSLTVSSFGHHGSVSSQLELNPGTAWFADAATGQASLLDGATASRVSVQEVSAQGDAIEIVQSGTQSDSGAYVINHSAGSITRIDGATLSPGHPVGFSPAGDANLAVASNPAATWVIRQDGTLAEEIDPATLTPLGAPQRYSSTGTPPVETSDGSLWTAGAGGYIYSYAADTARTRTHPAPGRFSLVEADSRPVAADITTGEAVILDPHSGQAARAVAFNPPGSAPIISGSGDAPYLISVDPVHAELQITDLNTHRSSGTAVIGDPGSGYGPAVINGNLIFVPNQDQQAVVVAEIEHDQVNILGQIGVGDRHFGLLDYNGSVWFDDPATNVAGVISADLTAWVIPKTGGTGAGHRVGQLGPIHLTDGTTIATHKAKPGGGLTPVQPAHPAGPTPAQPTHPVGSVVSHGGPSSSTGPTPTSTAPTTTHTTPAPPAPVPGFTWTPTSPHVGQVVTFTDTTTGAHHIFQWTFPGASPALSNAASPTETWSQIGTYNVTLVVTNNGQSYPVEQQVTVSAQPPPTVTVPDAPTMGTATAANLAAKVSFSAPAHDGGASITFYTATATDITDPGHGGQTVKGLSSPVTVPGLTAGNTYTFTVTATNSAGTGPASRASNAVVPAAPTVCGQTEIPGQSVGTPGGKATWVVPTGVTRATFTLVGAAGGGSPSGSDPSGGFGTTVAVTLNVTPCDVWDVYVGGAGQAASNSTGNGGAGGASAGGYGGGSGGNMAEVADNVGGAAGGGGGAATVVTDGPFTEIAGGGGGAGGDGAGNPTVNPPVPDPPGYAGANGNTSGNGGPGSDGLDGAGGLAGKSGSNVGGNGAGGVSDNASLDSSGAGGGGGGGRTGGDPGQAGTCDQVDPGPGPLCGAGGAGAGGTYGVGGVNFSAKLGVGTSINGSVSVSWTA
jgi:Fibronectin type III domain